MLTPLAHRLFPENPDGRRAREEFFQDARLIFASEHGHRVLRTLCAVANPMQPRLADNALDMAADDYSDPRTRLESRRLMRQPIAHHLGGKTLQSRRVLGELQEL